MGGMIQLTGGTVHWGSSNRHDTPKAVTVADQSLNDSFFGSSSVRFSFTWDISDGDKKIAIPVPFSSFNPRLMLKTFWLQNIVGPSGTTLTASIGTIQANGTILAERYMANLSPSDANTGTNTDASDTELTDDSSNILLPANETMLLVLTKNSETTGIMACVVEFIRFETI